MATAVVLLCLRAMTPVDASEDGCSRSSMTTLPKGKQVIGIILRLAIASGMPMIV